VSPATEAKVLAGSCLCGGVRFEIRGPFLRANHCHCSRCRKHGWSPDAKPKPRK
jgi:hypothetical protein